MTPVGPLLDDIYQRLTAAAAGYYPTLTSMGLALMAALFVLQLGIVVAQTPWHDPYTIVHNVMLGLIRMGAIWAVMDHIYDWGSDIVSTGTVVGERIVGVSLTPSRVFQMGLDLVGDIWHATSWGLWFSLSSLSSLIIMTFIIWGIWLIAAVAYLFLLLEGVYAVAAGGYIVAFSALEYTWPTLMAWGAWLLSIAARIMITVLLLAVGVSFALVWVSSLHASALSLLFNLHRTDNASRVMVGSLLFAITTIYLPHKFGAVIRTQLGGAGYAALAEAASGAAIDAAAATARVATGVSSAGGSELASYVQRKIA